MPENVRVWHEKIREEERCKTNKQNFEQKKNKIGAVIIVRLTVNVRLN